MVSSTSSSSETHSQLHVYCFAIQWQHTRSPQHALTCIASWKSTHPHKTHSSVGCAKFVNSARRCSTMRAESTSSGRRRVAIRVVGGRSAPTAMSFVVVCHFYCGCVRGPDRHNTTWVYGPFATEQEAQAYRDVADATPADPMSDSTWTYFVSAVEPPDAAITRLATAETSRTSATMNR